MVLFGRGLDRVSLEAAGLRSRVSPLMDRMMRPNGRSLNENWINTSALLWSIHGIMWAQNMED